MVIVRYAICDQISAGEDSSPTEFQDEIVTYCGKNGMNKKWRRQGSQALIVHRELAIPNLSLWTKHHAQGRFGVAIAPHYDQDF